MDEIRPVVDPANPVETDKTTPKKSAEPRDDAPRKKPRTVEREFLYDSDFLHEIVSMSTLKKVERVSEQALGWAVLATNILMAMEASMTNEYVARFKCKPPAAMMVSESTMSNYMNEILLCYKLVEMSMKSQWTRLNTIKSLQLELHVLVKKIVEKNIISAKT